MISLMSNGVMLFGLSVAAISETRITERKKHFLSPTFEDFKPIPFRRSTSANPKFLDLKVKAILQDPVRTGGVLDVNGSEGGAFRLVQVYAPTAAEYRMFSRA